MQMNTTHNTLVLYTQRENEDYFRIKKTINNIVYKYNTDLVVISA